MPWKFCPSCKEISYSAATHYDSWPCPHCGTELKDEPDYDIHQAKALRAQYHPEKGTSVCVKHDADGLPR